MDLATAQKLAQLTSTFYVQVSDSFSATRSAPWTGWQQVLVAAGLLEDSGDPVPGFDRLSVLDLACGNLRFERYLSDTVASKVGQSDIEVHAVDNCRALAEGADIPGVRIRYTQLDIAEALWEERDLGAELGADAYDLVVCFGFMHHLPLVEQRARLMKELVAAVRPEGMVAVSFWHLSRSERLLRKARTNTAAAVSELAIEDLDEGDYLLGWQERTDVWRYCHDFSEEEVDALVVCVSDQACELARYSADGATANLNRYVLLRRQ